MSTMKRETLEFKTLAFKLIHISMYLYIFILYNVAMKD